MNVDGALLEALAAGLSALVLSVCIERFLRPRPFLKRPRAAWAAHAGLCCAGYGLVALLIGRPWCAVAAVSAVMTTLALVSNAKMRSLREPFIFQDYDYFLDAVRHPRFFLPFLGVKNFTQAAGFFLLALVGLYCESPPAGRFAWNGQSGGLAIVLGAAVFSLWRASRSEPPVSFNPERDLRALGLLGGIWAYGRAGRIPPDMRSPFDADGIRLRKPCPPPHLVAVQHESFFDARVLYGGIRPGVLDAFDSLRLEATSCGALVVPAWGANTVRTEFAFLTGVNEEGLGAHRFNPYRAVARGLRVSSLPMFLKSRGYRAVCIHPYWERYYSRDKVFRRFGFDEFLDIRSFAVAGRAGPYVADAAVGEKIISVLREASCPTFIFAITMENHGPLHLERARPSDVADFYASPPPDGCGDLTVYLRHLRNTNEMLRSLRSAFTALDAQVEFCCFGDHVPIMPEVYKTLGAPQGTVPYLCWSNRRPQKGARLKDAAPEDASAWPARPGGCQEASMPARLLAPAWLRSVCGQAAAQPGDPGESVTKPEDRSFPT